MSTIIIPARFDSKRYPGKPLAMLKGCNGVFKTLLERTWQVAMQVNVADRVIIATDDVRIQQHAQNFGAEVIMTSKKHVNGTERVAEVVNSHGDFGSIIVNLQGDAPLTSPKIIERLILELRENELNIATPVLVCDQDQIKELVEDRRNARVGATTVVFDKNNNALYFSKEVIPYISFKSKNNSSKCVFHHIGVYAYTASALKNYISFPVGQLEKQEGLEQLRFLENGYKIKCVQFDLKKNSFWELNNPSDVPKIEKILTDLSIE